MNDGLSLLPIGATWGDYEVRRVLGRGAFGAVYEAIRLSLGRRVALKVMHRSMLHNADATMRFLQEGRAASQVQHPNIVAITNLGTYDGLPFLELEFLEGETLESRVQREVMLSIPAAIDTLLPVLSAVSAMHEHGIVHRDLKPSNLFLSVPRRGVVQPKVLDFGIAKVRSEFGAGHTQTGSLMGTPAYMSPEQFRGAKHLDGQSDQWSLAVILIECLVGQNPFSASDFFETSVRVVRDPLPDLRRLRPDLPPGLESVILRALQREPASRFPRVLDLARALIPFASDVGRLNWAEEFGVESSLPPPPPLAPTVVSIVPSASWSPTPTTLPPSIQSTERRKELPSRRPLFFFAVAATTTAVVGVLLGLTFLGAPKSERSQLTRPAATPERAVAPAPLAAPTHATIPAPAPRPTPPVAIRDDATTAARSPASTIDAPTPMPTASPRAIGRQRPRRERTSGGAPSRHAERRPSNREDSAPLLLAPSSAPPPTSTPAAPQRGNIF